MLLLCATYNCFMNVKIELPKTLKDAVPISDDTRETLFWYLCASKNWHVGFIAEKVTAEAQTFELAWGDDEVYSSVYDLSIRFNAGYPRHPYAPLASTSTTEKFTRLPLYRDSAFRFYRDFKLLEKRAENFLEAIQGLYTFTSFLELSLGSNIWVDVQDTAHRRSRKGTVAALNYVADLLASASKGKDLLYHELLADGSIKIMSDTNNATVITDVEIGSGFVTGYINMGEKGYIHLSAYDDQTRDLLPDLGSHPKSFTGWSANPTEYFYFKKKQVCIGGDGALQNVRLDINFISANGLATTLFSTNCVVKTMRSRRNG